MRFLILVLAAGCINQAMNAISPPAVGGGTSTCREIVETCDSQCHDPLCLRDCSGHGTVESAQQHTALVDCAQANGCLDEACIRAGCPEQSTTCEGPPPPVPPS